MLNDRRVRIAAICAGAAVGVLLITQFVLPGGAAGKGTPMAILFQGLVRGAIASMVTIGLVLVFRSQRIINFAQGVIGSIAAVFMYLLMSLDHLPFWVAMPIGLLAAVIVGFGFEMIFIKRFFNAPRLLLTVFTVFAIPVVGGAIGYVMQLPIFPPVEDRTLDEISGRAAINTPFKSWEYQIGDLPLKFGFGHVFALIVAALALVGLAAFLRYSRTGVAVRAASQNAERARLLGIDVGRLSLVVWVLGALLSGLSAISGGLVENQFSFGNAASPEFLLVPLVAAVLARLESFSVAVFSSVAVSVLQSAVQFSYNDQDALVPLGLFLIVTGTLAWRSRKQERSEAADTDSWKIVEEYRAIPNEFNTVAGVRVSRRVLLIIGGLVVLLWPWVAPTRFVNTGGYLVVICIAMLSLVVLTGWAGQPSLGQWGFVALGAVLGGAATNRLGIPFWIALVIVPVIISGLAIVIGIPALRIRGLLLAVVTSLFAVVIQLALFNESYFGWLLPQRVDRPTLFLLDFEDERSMYYLCVIVLAIIVVGVLALRRTRPGRVLIAVRDNEPNLRSFGASPVRLRLAAFGISGFICGVAGVMVAHHQRAAQASSFGVEISIFVFLFAVAGGVGTVGGAIIGTVFYGLQHFIGQGIVRYLLVALLPLFVLYISPGGAMALVIRMRDGVLRIIASRKQLIVPSLFADIDPEVLAQRLIPLGAPVPNSGLRALSADRRYKLTSGLYSGRAAVATTTQGRDAGVSARPPHPQPTLRHLDPS